MFIQPYLKHLREIYVELEGLQEFCLKDFISMLCKGDINFDFSWIFPAVVESINYPELSLLYVQWRFFSETE